MATSSLLEINQTGVLALGAATEYSPGGIVSRTVLTQPGLRMTLFGFAAGQELTEHATSSRAFIQILTGSSEWKIAGEARSLHAGDLLHLPPGTPHAVRAEEAFSMLLTLVRETGGATD